MRYQIKSERGYWLPGGYGYTQDPAEAGVFSLADMEAFNLDGCSLERASCVSADYVEKLNMEED